MEWQKDENEMFTEHTNGVIGINEYRESQGQFKYQAYFQSLAHNTPYGYGETKLEALKKFRKLMPDFIEKIQNEMQVLDEAIKQMESEQEIADANK